jgi:hypothetical protein
MGVPAFDPGENGRGCDNCYNSADNHIAVIAPELFHALPAHHVIYFLQEVGHGFAKPLFIPELF